MYIWKKYSTFAKNAYSIISSKSMHIFMDNGSFIAMNLVTTCYQSILHSIPLNLSQFGSVCVLNSWSKSESKIRWSRLIFSHTQKFPMKLYVVDLAWLSCFELSCLHFSSQIPEAQWGVWPFCLSLTNIDFMMKQKLVRDNSLVEINSAAFLSYWQPP